MAIRKRAWKKPNGETGEAWVVDYKANGKRHIKTFKTKKEATAFRDATGVEVRQGRHVAEATSITVAEAAAVWIKAVKWAVVTIHQWNVPLCVIQRESEAPHRASHRQGEAEPPDAGQCCSVPRSSAHQAIAVMAKKVLTSFQGIMSEAELAAMSSAMLHASQDRQQGPTQGTRGDTH